MGGVAGTASLINLKTLVLLFNPKAEDDLICEVFPITILLPSLFRTQNRVHPGRGCIYDSEYVLLHGAGDLRNIRRLRPSDHRRDPEERPAAALLRDDHNWGHSGAAWHFHQRRLQRRPKVCIIRCKSSKSLDTRVCAPNLGKIMPNSTGLSPISELGK